MRTPRVYGNWKMHKTLEEAEAFAQGLAVALEGAPLARAGGEGALRVALFPAFPFLAAVAARLGDSGIEVGAQCCHFEPEGAYTGAVSCEAIASVGARHVLVGHSERRRIFREEDAELNLMLRAAFATGLEPVLCVGESLEEREAERTFAVLTQQLVLGLDGLSVREVDGLVIAYEPVWAIGTGRTATTEQAVQAHTFIRETLAQRFSDELATRTPILYGGSVKPQNAGQLMAQDQIDGVLVGGASLEVESFQAIASAAL